MSEPYVVRPDSGFIARVLERGGEDVKKCYQCATCSVVCDLSEGGAAFPRKEMIWAQWGLKDRLMADPDVWLCHQCNDCTTHCPRGARPGDVMAAVRREAILHYAFPGFLARWVSRPMLLPLALLIPALILGLAYLAKAPVGGALGLSAPMSGKVVYSYSSFLPHWFLIGLFALVCAFVVLAAAVGATRFWKAMKAADSREGDGSAEKPLIASLGATIKSVFAHENFARCTANRSLYVSHAFAFWGFVGLSLIPVWILTIKFNPLIPSDFAYPFNFWNPWRMLANIGGVAVLAGCGLMIWQRLAGGGEGGEKSRSASTYFDWAFVVALFAVVATGFGSEVLHYARLEPHRHVVYAIHLVLVAALLLYLPYSKFSHLIYRATAMVYAEHSGRKCRGAASVAGEV